MERASRVLVGKSADCTARGWLDLDPFWLSATCLDRSGEARYEAYAL